MSHFSCWFPAFCICLIILCGPVVMYRWESWTIKKGWAPKNLCFQISVLEQTLENLLDCKEIKPVNPKGNQSWILIGRTDAEAETPNFGHLMWRTDSSEKTLMLGKIEVRGEGDYRGWNGWMASLTLWTWAWASSGSGWWTEKPGVLQSKGLQRVRHDRAAEHKTYYGDNFAIYTCIKSLCHTSETNNAVCQL